MKNIFSITLFSFKDLIRSKVFFGTLLLIFVQIFITYISYKITYLATAKVLIDLGLSILNIFSLLIAIFLGSTLISKEIENKTIYIILSKGVKRWEFYFGKIGGLILFLFINGAIMGTVNLILIKIVESQFHFYLYPVIFVMMLESFFVIVLSIFFSFLMNTTLTVIATLSIYIFSYAVTDIVQLKLFPVESTLSKIFNILSWILPNFSKGNLKEIIIYGEGVSGHQYSLSLLYLLLYSLIFILMTLWIYRTKDLN